MLVQGVLCSAIVLIVSSIVLSLSGSRIRLRRRSVSEPAPHRPSQAMAYFVLSGTVIFSVLYFEYLFHALERTRIGWKAPSL